MNVLLISGARLRSHDLVRAFDPLLGDGFQLSLVTWGPPTQSLLDVLSGAVVHGPRAVLPDPEDESQEAQWGFPVRGKEAELLLRDAFRSRWGSDRWQPTWTVLGNAAHGPPGLSWSYPWISPSSPLPVAPAPIATYPAAP